MNYERYTTYILDLHTKCGFKTNITAHCHKSDRKMFLIL